MAKQQIELGPLGSEVARVIEQRRWQRDLAIERARSKFLALAEPAAVPAKPRGRAARRNWLLGLVPACALVAAIAFSMLRGEAPLHFRVDGAQGDVDAWLAASREGPVAIQFEDGTNVRLERASRARVVGVTPHGAKVSLESGRVHAEVVHRPQSAWSFIAGPITVRVIGTKFDLEWDAGREQFTVTVAEGSVGVSGSLAGAERAVRSGETLSISLRDRRLELINAHSESPAVAGDAQASEASIGSKGPASFGVLEDGMPRAESSATPLDSVAPSAAAAPTELVPARKAPHWRELAERGQLREAYAAAESFGFTEACQSASPSELLLLGDAARLAGRPDRASTALLALRQRYPSDSRRAAAAFVLGKVAFDQRRAYDVAAQWFTTCLREQPAGGFAREAAGRLIEAYRSAGNRDAAQIAARSYLARYPNGPHADLARSLLP